MATARAPISRGERVPDFALPRGDDAEGPTRFYGLVGGRPGVLLLAGADGRRADELAARLADEAGLDIHVVVAEPAEAPAGAFVDAGGQVHAAFGADEQEPVAVVHDPNLRVTATTPLADVAAARDAVLAGLPRAPAADAGVAPRLAPVLFVPDAIAEELRMELVERWRTEGHVATGVETVVEDARAEATDLRRKRRRDHTVTDQQLLRRLTRHVGDRVFPELEKAFAFRAGGFEGFKIGCYTAEDRGHFEAHRDNLSAATAHRRFGLTLNLNDDYEGGELRFPEYGTTRYRPAAGEALVFSGSHLHEVLPVERGQRFVLLSFVLAR